MLIEIPGVLNQVQLDKIHEILDTAVFVDGKLTAGAAAPTLAAEDALAALQAVA